MQLSIIMKLSVRNTLIIIISVALLTVCAKFFVGVYITRDWNKYDIKVVNCPKNNLLHIKDIEGNSFIFVDIEENSNLKTNDITFNEKKLGIKSLVKIKGSEQNLTYLSKNTTITYSEITDLQECYKQDDISVSNNYDFNNPIENTFCSVAFQGNQSYTLDKCD
jgi:hypothetical protein